MRYLLLLILALGFLPVGPVAQKAQAQADLSFLPQDYKCGISIRYSGTSGVDYLAEPLFHEPLQNNRQTVYIKSATTISLFHNQINSLGRYAGEYNMVVGAGGPDTIVGNSDDGTIRYRVDGDLNEKRVFANDNPIKTIGVWAGMVVLPAYSAPLSFASLEYSAGVPVLGRTGDNGQPITNPATYFHYGHLDSAGDEWHTLDIGDDDRTYGITRSYKVVDFSSDGKQQLFVVNPKTPCVTVERTGNGQFYTTPAKAYFIPKIHDQTTYILPRAGTVSVKLTDIYGGVVQYRLNGGSWTNNGTNVVTLADSAFSTGTNTLEARYAATPTVIRTRTVVKNPGFPSAGEAHGHLMWGDSTEYAKIAGRLNTGRYANYWNTKFNTRSELQQTYWDTYGMQGFRRPWFGADPVVATAAFENGFMAKVLGNDAKISVSPKTYAQYAKEMLLDNVMNLDTVTSELNSNQFPAPWTEFRGAGYNTVPNVFSFAPGYDLLIANYRSDQHADGITPIEDYFIRDQMGQYNLRILQNYAKNGPGLWGTATSMGAFMISLAMPTYNTPYFGTSGVDGTAATHLWTPYPDYPETWKNLFINVAPATRAYPNRLWAFGPDRPDDGYDLIGNSGPALGYWEYQGLGYWNLMARTYSVLTNLSAIHTSNTWPVIHQGFLYTVTGAMRGALGTADEPTPIPPGSYKQMLFALNDRHPTVVGPGRQALIDRGPANPSNLFDLIWYDDGGAVSAVLNPTFSPGSGTYASAQTVTIASATGGATIRYTTNGTTPTISTGTVYSGPVTVSATGTLKAIAYNGVITPSQVTSAAYIIDESVPVVPPPVNTPARLQGGTKVGKDSVRMGN